MYDSKRPILSSLDAFFSSKFSIEWAKDHTNEFEVRSEEFFKEDSCSVFTEADADTSYQLLKIKVSPVLPRSLLGHATDVVYNLRAALVQAIRRNWRSEKNNYRKEFRSA